MHVYACMDGIYYYRSTYIYIHIHPYCNAIAKWANLGRFWWNFPIYSMLCRIFILRAFQWNVESRISSLPSFSLFSLFLPSSLARSTKVENSPFWEGVGMERATSRAIYIYVCRRQHVRSILGILYSILYMAKVCETREVECLPNGVSA